ncbi:MAG: nucleotide-binding protein [Candidatus Krumholzibacteriia bacterium]|nr:nucleotide-binding protein [bacterium]MCB9513445.1 nucleotide-binding protein [Candidatus Latescibacterota bacterium]MCB9516159.1 nucleotide-binding protein [Candidatus Latescibacterota bacterium]
MRRSLLPALRSALSLGLLALAVTALAASGEIAGKVVETMNTDSYTYVHVKGAGGEAWAAAPRFEVKVGDEVAFSTAMPMKDFKSETLKRTFDVVYFTGEIRKLDGSAPAPSQMANPQGGAAATPRSPHTSAAGGEAVKAIAPPKGGMAIASLVSAPGDFAGKRVTVKGKVVKFNANIMGKNWLHLRDGSASNGADDICITSADVAKVGDVVVATGVVSTNKDFGSGYRYDVMIEEASIAAP